MARRGYFDDMGQQPRQQGSSEGNSYDDKDKNIDDNHNHSHHHHLDDVDHLMRHRYLALVYDVMIACSGGKSSLSSASFSGGSGGGGGGSGGGGALMWKGMNRIFTALRPHLMHALTAQGNKSTAQTTISPSTKNLTSTNNPATGSHPTFASVGNFAAPTTSPTASPPESSSITSSSSTISHTTSSTASESPPTIAMNGTMDVSEGLVRVVRMIELGNT